MASTQKHKDQHCQQPSTQDLFPFFPLGWEGAGAFIRKAANDKRKLAIRTGVNVAVNQPTPLLLLTIQRLAQ